MKINKDRNMMIRIFGIAVITCLIAAPLKAQIFLDDKALLTREGSWIQGIDEHGHIIPMQELEKLREEEEPRSYASIGGGSILLAALGGAYLVGRRKKEEK